MPLCLCCPRAQCAAAPRRQGELSPGGERELVESMATCPALITFGFLGHFILSLDPRHWIRKPGAGELAGRQMKHSHCGTLLCATWFGRMPLLASLVGKRV